MNSKPTIIDGEMYNYYTVSLAINNKCIDATTFDVSAAMRLVPTRIAENGNVITREDQAIPIYIGSVIQNAENDPAIANALGIIRNALQNFITNKGL